MGQLARDGNADGLRQFVEDCIDVLQAMSLAGVRHNALDVGSFLISEEGRVVVVDCEVSRGVLQIYYRIVTDGLAMGKRNRRTWSWVNVIDGRGCGCGHVLHKRGIEPSTLLC